MRKISVFLVILLSAFISMSSIEAAPKRIQAEHMSLTNYQIDSDGTISYIRLTDSIGVAKFIFDYPSGIYDLDVSYLSEKKGQNTYAIYLNDTQIVSWLGKNKDDRWHMLSKQQWHIPKNIAINKGDEIRIEALSENGSLAILDYIEFVESDRANSTTKQNLITIYPEEYENAIRNPLKGFRASFGKEHEYGTLVKSYIKWNEIENVESDGEEKIIKYCDSIWFGCEARNIKFIPRVYLSWPNQKSGWPTDMAKGDFTSEQFKQRVVALIKKLGKVWDNDSRVAFIEMGIVGEWGEMEWPDTKDDIKEAMAAQFSTSFQNKIVMIRWPNTYNDDIYNFGYYWDSWAHHDQKYYGFHLNNTSPKWKTAVFGGEVAYDWGNFLIQPGKNPDTSLSKPIHRDYIVNQIRQLHANHMGWIASYDHNNESVRAGAAIVQKAMGYRFVLTEFTYPKRIETSGDFTISFKVKNTGSTPFYYNWPVEVSLLDMNSKQPVWKNIFTNINIKNWMPGHKWDEVSNTYAIPVDIYSVCQSFNLSDIPSGEYILALAILDPAGNRPCARFAIKNYYNGGRHPIGKIGVNKKINSYHLSEFDDIQKDKSLSYDSRKN